MRPVKDASAGSVRGVGYSYSAEEFYVYEIAVTGARTPVTAGTAMNLTFDAFGDSAHDVELL